MEAVRYHEHGGPTVLAVEDVDRPTPDDDEVLVAVEAAAINPVDTYFREGSYSPATLPWIPGSDVAGVVESAGEAVDAFDPGDRVFATGLGAGVPGTCADYVAVPAADLARLPASVDFEAGAAVGLVGVTAWDTLLRACDLAASDRCLVHGGSGGVGHVAVQVAAAAGALVTTTASKGYHDRLTELGAETVLDYRRDDLAAAIDDAGAPDVILDHRLDDYLGLDVEVAASDAELAAIGNGEDPAATFPDVSECRSKALTVHHVSMFNVPEYRDVLSGLATLMDRDEVTPIVARRYGLADVAEAHRAVMEDSFLGKLVVTV
jgi:NADPH2:quinone reductase